MSSDNIFSGLKVVDLASFIAGPSAAVILSDFGADVIKVEPPTGDSWRMGTRSRRSRKRKDAYPWHLANRNKRGITLDLKSPSAQQVLERLVKWADVLIVNTPHPARKRLKLEYDDVAQWNPRLIYADRHGLRRKRSRRRSSGIRHHVVLGAKRFVVHDARRRRAADLAGGRQRRQCDRRRPVFRDRRRRFIVASAPARDPMSRRRSSPKASGRPAFRSRPRCARQSFSGCTTGRIPPMRR